MRRSLHVTLCTTEKRILGNNIDTCKNSTTYIQKKKLEKKFNPSILAHVRRLDTHFKTNPISSLIFTLLPTLLSRSEPFLLRKIILGSMSPCTQSFTHSYVRFFKKLYAIQGLKIVIFKIRQKKCVTLIFLYVFYINKWV